MRIARDEDCPQCGEAMDHTRRWWFVQALPGEVIDGVWALVAVCSERCVRRRAQGDPVRNDRPDKTHAKTVRSDTLADVKCPVCGAGVFTVDPNDDGLCGVCQGGYQ